MTQIIQSVDTNLFMAVYFCPSLSQGPIMASLPVWAHSANGGQKDARRILMASPLGQLETTSCNVVQRLYSKTCNQGTSSPLTKRPMWLRTYHSSGCCVCLALNKVTLLLNPMIVVQIFVVEFLY